MAACGRHAVFVRNLRIFKKFSLLKPHTSSSCSYSTSSEIAEQNNVKYPPVKPRYPPGKWGDISEYQAWKTWEQGLEIKSVPKAAERLEKIAGLEKQNLILVEALDRKPRLQAHKEYITKTHIIDHMLPEIYETECDSLVDSWFEPAKSVISDILLQEHEYHFKYNPSTVRFRYTRATDSRRYQAHYVVGQIINSLQALLSPDAEYLLRAQIDERVRHEAFWRRTGYGEEVGREKPNFDKSLMMQLSHEISYQIRTELPLPEFAAVDDSVCSGEVQQYNYLPSEMGMRRTKGKPTSFSGHRIGDPCEFVSTGIKVLGPDYDHFVKRYGEEVAHKDFLACGLMTAFTSTVAQAHGQGFSLHWDVTYPFTTQTIVTDGQLFRFIAYQLNTLQLWKSDDANPKRNVLWTMDNVKLYDVIEGGQVKGLNDDVIKMFLRFMVLKPRDRGVDLRPYLPEDEVPANKRLYINHVGDEPLPYEKIGRFQYPRESVYFYK